MWPWVVATTPGELARQVAMVMAIDHERVHVAYGPTQYQVGLRIQGATPDECCLAEKALRLLRPAHLDVGQICPK